MIGAVRAAIAAVTAWATAERHKRFYGVGDIAPASLLNRTDGSGPIGAWISVDPATNRITAIHAP